MVACWNDVKRSVGIKSLLLQIFFFFYVTNPFFMASRKKCVMWALHSEAPLVCVKDGLMEKKLQLYNMFWLLHGLTHWFLSRCSGEDRILQRPPCSPSKPSHQIQGNHPVPWYRRLLQMLKTHRRRVSCLCNQHIVSPAAHEQLNSQTHQLCQRCAGAQENTAWET